MILALRLISAGLCAAVLGGCFAGSSPPSRFYTLSSLRKADHEVPAASSNNKTLLVAVGPVRVPDYLDRPEIITRSGQNEINVNEFHRWSGSLESGISRVLIENLSELLPHDRFSIVRWSPSQTDMPIAYRLTLDIVSFDAAPGGIASLDSNWAIYGGAKEIVLTRKSSVREKIGGSDVAGVVSGMSRAVEDLSREIASAVIELEQKTAPGGEEIKR